MNGNLYGNGGLVAPATGSRIVCLSACLRILNSFFAASCGLSLMYSAPPFVCATPRLSLFYCWRQDSNLPEGPRDRACSFIYTEVPPMRMKASGILSASLVLLSSDSVYQDGVSLVPSAISCQSPLPHAAIPPLQHFASSLLQPDYLSGSCPSILATWLSITRGTS